MGRESQFGERKTTPRKGLIQATKFSGKFSGLIFSGFTPKLAQQKFLCTHPRNIFSNFWHWSFLSRNCRPQIGRNGAGPTAQMSPAKPA